MPDYNISDAIAVARDALADLDAAKVAAVDATLALDFEEHFHYQNLQAQCHASGKISTDTALMLYRSLGEVGSAANGGWAEGVDTATKYCCTRLLGMLLADRIKGLRGGLAAD